MTTDVAEQMSREPHPFVNASLMETMEGQTVAIVGKVDKIEAGGFTLRTSDGKLTPNPLSVAKLEENLKIAAILHTDQTLCQLRLFYIDKEIQVVNYKPNQDMQHITSGNSVEVRGVVGPGNQLTYSDLNRFEGDFDMGTYEQMLEYYHGLCKHLCVSSQN